MQSYVLQFSAFNPLLTFEKQEREGKCDKYILNIPKIFQLNTQKLPNQFCRSFMLDLILPTHTYARF